MLFVWQPPLVRRRRRSGGGERRGGPDRRSACGTRLLRLCADVAGLGSRQSDAWPVGVGAVDGRSTPLTRAASKRRNTAPGQRRVAPGRSAATRHLVAGWASGVLRSRYLWSPVGHSRVGQASPCSARRMSTIKAMQSSQANSAGVSPQTPHRLSRPQNEHFKSVSRVDEFMGHLGTRLGRLWRY